MKQSRNMKKNQVWLVAIIILLYILYADARSALEQHSVCLYEWCYLQ